MAIAHRPLTYDDLLQLPDDGYRYEIIDGELVVSPPPSRHHQKLAFRLALLVGNEVTNKNLGDVYFAPVDVKLGTHRVVQPDLLFIRLERRDIFVSDAVEGPP